MHENISPFRKKKIEILKNGVEKATKFVYKIEDKIHSAGNDNPLQAAVEHFPEPSPPVLGYFWFAFQPDCSNWHPAQNEHQKESSSPRDSPTFRHPFPSHGHRALEEPHPTVVPLRSSRSHQTRGLWGAAQHPDQGLCSGLRHWMSSHLSEACAELLPHLEQVFAGSHWLRDQAVVRVRSPSAVCTGCSQGMPWPPPTFPRRHFHTSIFLHIEPACCHSQSLYLNKPFCWTRIKYSPVESDTMREPRLEARERMRRRSQLNKYI